MSPYPSSISAFVRDALTVIHQQSLELIVRGASLDAILDALCDGIDALDPGLISSVLLADPDGQRLWPKAGRRRTASCSGHSACRFAMLGAASVRRLCEDVFEMEQ